MLLKRGEIERNKIRKAAEINTNGEIEHLFMKKKIYL